MARHITLRCIWGICAAKILHVFLSLHPSSSVYFHAIVSEQEKKKKDTPEGGTFSLLILLRLNKSQQSLFYLFFCSSVPPASVSSGGVKFWFQLTVWLWTIIWCNICLSESKKLIVVSLQFQQLQKNLTSCRALSSKCGQTQHFATQVLSTVKLPSKFCAIFYIFYLKNCQKKIWIHTRFHPLLEYGC